MDKAVADEAWQDENHDLLIAVGIWTCHLDVVPTINRVDVTKEYQFVRQPGIPTNAGGKQDCLTYE